MNLDHLLKTAGWDSTDDVVCLCGWRTEGGEGAFERWLAHTANPEQVLEDAASTSS